MVSSLDPLVPLQPITQKTNDVQLRSLSTVELARYMVVLDGCMLSMLVRASL